MAAADPSADPATGPSDHELIARVRDGDTEAYGALFARHVGAARRLARALLHGPDHEDLVSEAFTKTLAVLQGGGGPDEAFRAYLLTAVRRLHVDRIRRTRRVSTTDDLDDLDDGVAFVDPAVAEFEGGAAARAFQSLPERWQLVLWHLEVENDKPADIAPLLDLSPNSVSALAYRAREGLRQAYVTMHHTGDPDRLPTACRVTRDRLGGFVRGALARRERTKVDDHLDGCLPCTGVYLELREVNSSLAGLVGPVVLGGAAAAYLSGLGVGTAAAAAGSGSLLGGHAVGQLVGRARDAVLAHAGPAGATVAAGVTTLAVVTGTALVVQHRSEPDAGASRQVVSQGPLPSPEAGGTGGAGSGPSTAGSPSSRPTPTGPTLGARASDPGGTAPADAAPGDPEAPAPAPGAGSIGAGATDRTPGRERTPAAQPRETGGGAGARRADVALTATLTPTSPGLARITVTVRGVPAGQTAALVVTTGAGTLRALSSGCTGGGASLRCTTTASRSVVELELRAEVGTEVDLVLTGPDGWTDPVPSDNSVRLRA